MWEQKQGRLHADLAGVIELVVWPCDGAYKARAGTQEVLRSFPDEEQAKHAAMHLARRRLAMAQEQVKDLLEQEAFLRFSRNQKTLFS